MKTKELIDEVRALSEQTEAAPEVPWPKKRPSALRSNAEHQALADAASEKIWTKLNEELEPGRKQLVEAQRIEALLLRGDDAEILAEVSPYLESELERDAHKRVLKSWQDLDPEVFTSCELMRWADVLKRQMVGEGYLRYFVAAEKQEILTEKICNVRPQSWHDPAMRQLGEMARSIRAGW